LADINDIKLDPKTLLKCGIVEEYHDKDFANYYGYSGKWREIAPLIEEWNRNNPHDPIRLDYHAAADILKKVAEYAANIERAKRKGISIILGGSNGTGKTLLAVSILKRAIRKGFSAQMASLGGIIQIYTDGWSDPQKRVTFDERVKNVDFLLIDDVGKEYSAKNSDLTEVMFDNLIRYRVGRRKPFVLTTNTSASDMKNRYGNSLMSLLLGKCVAIQMVGEDYRRAILNKNLWEELNRD
jgi:DNA replication protein DnaC